MSDITQQDLTALRRDLQTDMREANRPIERRQDETIQELRQVNLHLGELNGKVAEHRAQLAAGGIRMDVLGEHIDNLHAERRDYVRRSEDRDESGEDRRISMRDARMVSYGAGLALGGISGGWMLLKILPALVRAAGGTP